MFPPHPTTPLSASGGTLWNTVYLGRAVEALRRQGEAVPDALLAHLARAGRLLEMAHEKIGDCGHEPLLD